MIRGVALILVCLVALSITNASAQNKTAGRIGVWSNTPTPNSLTDTGNATAPGNFKVEGSLNVQDAIKVVDLPKPPADAAQALEAAIVSDSHIIVPAGTYLFCSMHASQSIYNNIGPVAVLVQNKRHFTLDMRGAAFSLCNAIVSGYTGTMHFLFDKDDDFQVNGGSGIGNQTGKVPASGDSVFIGSNNNTNAVFNGQSITQGDWQSWTGVAFDGYWNDHVIFENMHATDVAKCYDFAFMSNVIIRNAKCSGRFQGGSGIYGISFYWDTTAGGMNLIGLPINDNNNNTIETSEITNFRRGWWIASGTNWKLSNNYFAHNIGSVTPPIQGFGGVIGYETEAGNIAGSIGHPVTGLQSVNDVYEDNGNPNPAVGGGGISVENGRITNTDVISGIRIASQFVKNHDRAIGFMGSAHIWNVSAKGSTCVGTTYCLEHDVLPVVFPVSTVASTNPLPLISGSALAIASLSVPSGNWILNGWAGIRPDASTGVYRLHAAISNACSPPSPPADLGAPGIIDMYTIPSVGPSQFPTGPVTVSAGGASNTYCLIVDGYFSGGAMYGFGSLSANRAD